MLLRRIASGLRDRDWPTLALELGLVVVGILLAFQLDRAYQGVQDRSLERGYLERLANDLRRDSAEIAATIARTEVRLRQVALLDSARVDPDVAGADPRGFVEALEQVTWRSIATISTGTFDELRSTGRSVLLQSESLRTGLADYYGFLEEQRRLALGEDDQDRFRVETVGLLPGRVLSSIEDPGRHAFDLSAAETIEIARDFGARTGAHSWLGRLAKYQVLVERVTREFQLRNQALLTQVDSLVGGG
jgi:hypothetical protein